MEDVEVEQLVPTAGGQIVVCQCHRSCWTWRWPSRRASTGAVPVKVADFLLRPVPGVVSAGTVVSAVAVLTLGSMSLLCRSSLDSWGLSCKVGEVGGRSSSHR